MREHCFLSQFYHTIYFDQHSLKVKAHSLETNCYPKWKKQQLILLYSCINCINFDLEYISSRYLSSCGIEGKAYRCKCVLDSSIIYMYIQTVVLLQKCFHSDNICGERARKPCVEAATGNDKANQKNNMCSWGNLTLPK